MHGNDAFMLLNCVHGTPLRHMREWLAFSRAVGERGAPSPLALMNGCIR